jgi:predicted DNA-binding transcriptional regulator YafY
VKGTVWYLIAGTDAGQRTFRVGRVTSVAPTGERAVRPDGFDLSAVWRDVAAEIDARRTPVHARALVEASAVGRLRFVLGSRLSIGGPTVDGRIEVVIAGYSPESLAADIGGLGAMVEVLSPAEARRRLAEIGAQLTAAYAGG